LFGTFACWVCSRGASGTFICGKSAGAAELAKALPSLLGLTSLRLARAALGTKGVTALAIAVSGTLAGTPSIHKRPSGHQARPQECRFVELDLERNCAKVSAAEVLAEAVARMRHLQRFLYAGNRPACEGLAKLAAALATCRALQVRFCAFRKCVPLGMH
jgi:hypothetical protein